MDKLKGMLKISERDKKLLLIVAAALIVVLAYFWISESVFTGR